MMMNYRTVRENTPDLPLHLPTDGVLDLVAVPRQGEEIRLLNTLLLVTRVMHRPGWGPLLILSERPLPEYRGQPYREPVGEAAATP
jgi:hypothetical protein